jgi:hypothetical protein
MLSLSTSNRVTFSVNVFGTATIPSVRCVVGDAPGLSFPASKLANGEWEVLIDLPSDTKPGSYPFKVEVLINGRLFTPINHTIDVEDVKPVQTAPIPAARPETPEPTPVISTLMQTVAAVPETVQMEPKAPEVKPKVPEVKPKVPEVKPKAPKVKVKTEKLELPKQKALYGLEAYAKNPVFKKPAVIEVAQVKVSIVDIANAAFAGEAKPKVVKRVQEARQPTIPVRLTKGAVIYR